jgi:hypothetical protein
LMTTHHQRSVSAPALAGAFDRPFIGSAEGSTTETTVVLAATSDLAGSER